MSRCFSSWPRGHHEVYDGVCERSEEQIGVTSIAKSKTPMKGRKRIHARDMMRYGGPPRPLPL